MDATQLLVFGLGYTGTAIARDAAGRGWRVVATSRTPQDRRAPPGTVLVAFDAAADAIAQSTHIVQTAAPDDSGDPALRRYEVALAAAPRLRWAGLLSTTGVYGDRGGAWVDEDTEPAPTALRADRRLAQERQWAAAFARCAVDLFRVAGIYGPGRSVLDELRAGRGRRVEKPGHSFGRIHRDDIAAAVIAAAAQDRPPSARVLNLADDLPAPSADVVAEGARLLGLPPPPLVPFDQALAGMSAMARSFWSDNRRVASEKTRRALGLGWRYPTYREGLRAIREQELAEGGP